MGLQVSTARSPFTPTDTRMFAGDRSVTPAVKIARCA